MATVRSLARANGSDPVGSGTLARPDDGAPPASAASARDTEWPAQDFPAGLDDWSPGNVGTTLGRLFSHAVQGAERHIAWYDRSGTRMGRRSRRLRFWAIVCGTVGTLFPLIDAAWTLPQGGAALLGVVDDASYLGYVLLAVAAALVAADSAFGVSSSWMRFRSTQTEMERLLAGFRLDWTLEMARLGGEAPNAEQRAVLLRLQRNFSDAIKAAAQSETAGWMQEFRGALAELARTYRPPAETRQPAIADAQVTNVIKAVGPITTAAGAGTREGVLNNGGDGRPGVAIDTTPAANAAASESRERS